jgi:hypothetical protein
MHDQYVSGLLGCSWLGKLIQETCAQFMNFCTPLSKGLGTGVNLHGFHKYHYFAKNRLITLKHCLNNIITKERITNIYLIAFLCGTGTSHVIAIDTHKSLLDTHCGEGRNEAFKFVNTGDIEHLMYLLFQVHCTEPIVSDVYLRMK